MPVASRGAEKPVGILLAAGRGKRFDASGRLSKLLQVLPDGRMVAVAAAQSLMPSCSRVLAVVPDDESANTGALKSALQAAGCLLLPCAEAKHGMGHSIAAGVVATAGAPGWLVMLGDLPLVQSASCQQVAEALLAGAMIAVPSYQGQRGHPVGFAANCGDDLSRLTGDSGARQLMQRYPVTVIALDDGGVLQDIDTTEDMLAMRARVTS